MQSIRNNIGLFVDRKGKQSVYLKTDANVTLSPQDHIVRVEGNTGAVAVTLPSVADCAGCLFAITAATGNTNATTVTDQDDSYGWDDVVLAGDEAGALIWCDGHKFWVIALHEGDTGG